jgi:hypothetical protein
VLPEGVGHRTTGGAARWTAQRWARSLQPRESMLAQRLAARVGAVSLLPARDALSGPAATGEALHRPGSRQDGRTGFGAAGASRPLTTAQDCPTSGEDCSHAGGRLPDFGRKAPGPSMARHGWTARRQAKHARRPKRFAVDASGRWALSFTRGALSVSRLQCLSSFFFCNRCSRRSRLEWCSYALDSETLPLCLRSIPRNPRRPISWRARPWARGGQCREVAFNGDGRGLDQPPGGGHGALGSAGEGRAATRPL